MSKKYKITLLISFIIGLLVGLGLIIYWYNQVPNLEFYTWFLYPLGIGTITMLITYFIIRLFTFPKTEKQMSFKEIKKKIKEKHEKHN